MDKIKFGGKEYLVKYEHTRNPKKSQGGATAAKIILNEDLSVSAVSLCHPKDNFCKKRGRVIALGRLKKLLKVEEDKYLRLIAP